MKIFHELLDMVYPRYCVGCDALLEQDEVLCTSCMDELPYTGFFGQDSNPVKEIFYGRTDIEHAGSLLFYTKDSLVQRLLFDLKYRQNKKAGKLFGYLLARTLQKTTWIKKIDLLVPMPVHKKKALERGYNQAAIIAGEVAAQLHIPMNENAVVKAVHTDTQTHKTREDRWASMQHVFEIKAAGDLQGRHVLLIDDVLTTGATLEVCGSELLKVKDLKLSVATVAYAI